MRCLTDADGVHTDLEELTAYVAGGGTLLVDARCGDDGPSPLTGVGPGSVLPPAEWFVALAERPESARLDPEVAVHGPLQELRVLAPDVEVLATVSVGFRPVIVLTQRRVGRGRVLTSGFPRLDLLGHDVLGRFVRRVANAACVSAHPLGLGVVGYGPHGGMGYLHGLAATETDGWRLAAVADPVSARLDAALAAFPGASAYASAQEIAGDASVDVAIVATPPSAHADLAVALLDGGKHVVVEKPMCLTVADADRMIAAAAANDRVLTVHQSRRWDADFLALRRAVASGALGDVFNVETFVGGFEHPCRAWHSEESISGGAVYDWGSHHIDWILALYGEAPSRIVAHSHKRVWHDVTNADQVTVWMRWRDGREATFRQSDVTAIRRPKFHVQGTRGTLEGHYRPLRVESVETGRGFRARTEHHAEAPVDLRLVRYETGYGHVEELLPPAPHAGWGFHRNLADHLLLGEPLAVPAAQSRAVVRVLEAAQRAGAHGSATVDLDDER